MEFCNSCPLKTHCPELDVTCKAISLGHIRYCELTNPEHKDFNEAYVYKLCDENQPKAPQRVKREIDPANAYNIKMAKLITGCQHRSVYRAFFDNEGKPTRSHEFLDGTPAEGCGCGKMKCRIEKGSDGNVSLDDCKRCVIERGLIDPLPEKASLLQQVVSVTKSTIKHVAAGMPKASEQEKSSRLEICKSCDHYENGRCGICRCVLTIKCGWAGESCPLNPPKWTSIRKDEP